MTRIERLAIADLSQDPANARLHPERNLSAITASLRRFGQQTPIVIDKSNVVRKGNGTLQAAMAMGWDEIDCIRTELTSSDAIAYAIADNRTSELAEWDDDVLSAQLQGLLTDDESLMEAAGFDDDELASLLIKVMAEADCDDEDDGSAGDDEEPKDTTSFILLLTADQEILFRKAIAEARRNVNAETASEAVIYIMEKWLDGKV